MANSKISALTSATTPLAGTEVLPIVQSSTTKQVSVDNLTAGRTQTSNGIVQGTAATGYNFSANTPLAGKTSTLLNWYEEGTWTPTDTSGAGLTFTGVVAKYTRIGRQVTANCLLTFPATASAAITSISLPFSCPDYVIGICNATTGNVYSIVTTGGTANATIRNLAVASLANLNLSTATIAFTIVYTVT